MVYFSPSKISLLSFPGRLMTMQLSFLLFILQLWHEYCYRNSRGIYTIGNVVAAPPGEDKAPLAAASEKGGTKAADYHL
jgi:hypothetical protein